jgi:hypothetical protein
MDKIALISILNIGKGAVVVRPWRFLQKEEII